MLKWVSLALLVLLALMQYHLWMGEGGIFELRSITARVDALNKTDQALRERNDQLVAEVIDLRTGLDAVEERARTDLGMVRNGEQFMWVPDVASSSPDSQPDDTDGSADSSSEGGAPAVSSSSSSGNSTSGQH
ncbi:Cell division protein FtsB [Halomonadaceae bacterium LMG 33818]|uniref:cell division protein FtsB n=1 Tax=Cernens ardua TaxID=3402176 RepID=UPI003EDBAC8C